MTFTISIFLIPYYIFLGAWLILSLVAVFHMLKFGFRSFITFFSTFLFAAIAVLMVSASFYYINQIDWSAEILIFDKNAPSEIIFE